MLERRPGKGWLALIGGGEFSFGETEEADAAWLDKAKDGAVGFVPAASGSAEYGEHLSTYLEETFGRTAETVPIYRARDAGRGRNLERLASSAAVYLGGGVSDHLLEALSGSLAEKALLDYFESDGVVVAIAAAAQACGAKVRSLLGREVLDGLGWLPGGFVETNFEPEHDRRLRKMMQLDEIQWGLALPAGSAVLFGPDGGITTIGESWVLHSAEGELQPLGEPVDLDSEKVN